MYICKECGAEVKLNFSGDIYDAKISIDKECNGIVNADDIEMNWWTYTCTKCNTHNKNINEIAIWKD